MTRSGGQPRATIFAQLLGLVVLTLVGAITINLLVILNLPPPTPDFYRLSEIARAARSGRDANLTDGRVLLVRPVAQPVRQPRDDPGFPVGPKLLSELATEIGAPVSDVRLDPMAGRFADRKVIGLVRQVIAKDGSREEHFLVAPFVASVRTSDGRWLEIRPRPRLGPSAWQARIVIGFLLSTIALSPFAYILAGRLAAPIELFAEAAERLGRDPRSSPMALRGPAEIAAAGRAFNEMQGRLARYVEDRTAMVGAIAHDLRTPLTRLRFRIESAPEDLRQRMEADIDEMEAMVAAALSFVKGESNPPERARLELVSLLESLADDLGDTGRSVTVEACERMVVVEGDSLSLRRLFGNLLENALAFGQTARVRVRQTAREAVVEIADDGPGIAQEDLERVFEPFQRGEASRSRQTGGIGLGLAVVRSIARAHGGEARLSNTPGGGLTATVTLPL